MVGTTACIVVIVGLVSLWLVKCFVKPSTTYYAFSRWLRMNSELMDRSIGHRFARKLQSHLALRDPNRRIMLGSSTISWMPNVFETRIFANLGVPSLCTHHMIHRLDLVRMLRAEVVLLYIGINDTIFHTPADVVARNIGTILEAISAKRVIYIPLIESAYQQHLGDTRCTYIREINAMVERELAFRPNVTTIDVSFDVDEFGFDGLHLNENGNAHLARVVSNTLDMLGVA